ncbi:MAG: hypothetical protein QM401_04285 [Bacillota bacterium]|nr:hypothetical protein [Bacillota bacterium]
MKVTHEGKDITKLITELTWSGDYKQAARTVDFGVAAHPHDTNLPTVDMQMGDMIKLFDSDDNELFQGYLFYREKSINGKEISNLAYDGLVYLLKSRGTYNFKSMTPQAITQKVCNDFGIPVGELAPGSPLNRLFDAEQIYNIIMTAYTIESNKTGKVFMARMNNGKLNVTEKGWKVARYILDGETSISEAVYSESMEDSINRVKIYDEEGQYVGEVTLDGIPGILQDIYKVEQGQDAQSRAKGLLKGIQRTAELEGLGDLGCIAGNAVVVQEPHTGLAGLFYIDADEHTWSEGQHTMRLSLNFQNLMDAQEAGQLLENKDRAASSKSGYF